MMKVVKLITVAASFVVLYGCNTNLDEVIYPKDRLFLQEMETSFLNAVQINDSLAEYVDLSGITNDKTCLYFDSLYHHYDFMFETNHEGYSHCNSGDDHASNSWTMGAGMTNNGMMHQNNMGSGSQMDSLGFNLQNCTWNYLALMDALMDVHEYYHPGD